MWKSTPGARALLLVALVATACAHAPAETHPEPMALPSGYRTLTDVDFPDVIEEVGRAAESQIGSRERAATQRLLARLHLHPQNPEPDVRAALGHLELSASLDPECGRSTDVQTWLVLLRRVVDALDERTEIERRLADLQRETAELRDREARTRATTDQYRHASEALDVELQTSRAEIDKLRATIDELQRLDLRMERRRRTVRTTAEATGSEENPAQEQPLTEKSSTP